MKNLRLRNKLLLSAVAISMVVVLASMLGVSWVIRQQHLEQSASLLRKADNIIEDSLEERKLDLLQASRQLAAQKNLGSTIWYLSQYAQSSLDRETLAGTYLGMVRDAARIGHVAGVSKIAIYDSAGRLVVFVLFEGDKKRIGYVERSGKPLFRVATLKADDEVSAHNLPAATSIAGVNPEFGGELPQQENAYFAVAEGALAIEAVVPVRGETFDPRTGKPEIRQLGLVVMEEPLDNAFAMHLAWLTDTEVNIFTPQGYSSGSEEAYQTLNREGVQARMEDGETSPVSNEVSIGKQAYYQSLVPLYNGKQLSGTIAVLYSKETVRKNTWAMIRVLGEIAAASLLLILPFAWYFAFSISRPLTLLSRAFLGVASDKNNAAPGDELSRLKQEGVRHDELGDLTQSFIAMSDAVNQKIHEINEINASLEQKVWERTAALAASEQESRTLIENSPDTIARYGRDCRRSYVNPAFGAMAEGGVGALLGKTPSEVPGGPNAAIYEAKIREVFASGEKADFELKWGGKDGKEICSHIRLVPEFDLSGNVVTVLGVGRDITELNDSRTELSRAAEALRRNDELLMEAQTIAGLGSYMLDIPTGRITSSAMLDGMLGIDETYEHSGHGWGALIHPDDKERVFGLFNEALRQGKPFDIEYRIIRPNDGAERWVHGLGRLERDAAGDPVSMHGTLQDITSRKLAEQQLNSLLAFNSAIVESSPAGIAVYRQSGPCIMANEAYARTIGATVEEMLEQDFRHNPSWQRNGLLDLANAALETGTSVCKDVEGTTSFGKRVILSGIFTPITIAGEKHLLVITNDISERVVAERALTGTMRKLEEKELAKTRFLAAAGHDLRQPLAAINLFIDAFKFTGPNPRQEQIIRHLEQTMATFNGLLDALLNISKLDAGVIRPEFAEIRVSELMNWLEQSFAALAASKNLGFRMHLSMREPLAVYSDIGLVKSVLMNLVSNAVKFTQAGAILVSARRRGDEVLFQVWDTGMGIQEEHIERIFEEFYQVGNPQRDRESGLGLGLSIVQRAITLLGGNIKCRSRPGRGTVFEFRLPSCRGSSEAVPQVAGGDNAQAADFIRGKRFVLVEDDKLVAQAMINVLEGVGGEVRCFHSAEEALLNSHIERADCYIVDYMLGGAINGAQFLAQLRQRLNRPIVAVLVTGDTSAATLRQVEGGDWPVLHKPVSVAQLSASLGRQMSR